MDNIFFKIRFVERMFVNSDFLPELESVTDNIYLSVTVEDSRLIITTTDEYKNFEANEISGSGEHVITIRINLKCETSEISSLVCT